MNNALLQNIHFKTFGMCRMKWATREDFLKDPGIEMIGYQVRFEELSSGLFLFNHSCKSTLAIDVASFRDFYDGTVFKTHAHGTENCPEYCLHESNLAPCPSECECAFVREIIQIIKNVPKTSQ